jgi:hypothetical protein
MATNEKKELAKKLEQNILTVLSELNPTLSKKIQKDVKLAGKEISKKWSDIQEAIEKKAKKALKKQTSKTAKSPKDKKAKKDKA